MPSATTRELLRLWWRDWPFLVVFALIATTLWAFFEITDEVIEGSTLTIDRAFLLALRNPTDRADPLGPIWFEELMRDFTALGGVGILSLVTVGALGYLTTVNKPRAALAVLVTVAGGISLSMAMKIGFDRPRPDLVAHGSYVSSASFPSGHSMMAAVVYLTLAVMLAQARPHWRLKLYILGMAVLITLLIGASRVYLGVHWPTDVLAGWTMGSAWALSCGMAARVLQRLGIIENDIGAG